MNNTSIVGSNKERKSKIDFELVDRLNEEYKNVKKESTPEETITPLESKMQEYYENGMPKITLKYMLNKVVPTPTQKDYDTLMQVYECGGWKWHGDDNLAPTDFNAPDNDNIFIDAKMGVKADKIFTFADVKFFQEQGYKILSLTKFYSANNITNFEIEEINSWFDKNKPNRESKG